MKEMQMRDYESRPHILVIDDDDRIRELVSRYLREQDFVVNTAVSAADAREIRTFLKFDAIIADIMMPDETGLEYTRSLRQAGDNMPVLLLTALGETDDRITGLESGADDYLPKPFEPKELLLRIQAILRRMPSRKKTGRKFRIGPWLYNPEYKFLDDGEKQVNLTGVEDKLLQALASHSGQALSRDDLARLCEIEEGSRTIDVQITRLRKKIEEDSRTPRYIQTVRGKGYQIQVSYV